MKSTLQLRFSQNLAITPQLRESIRLLQLSNSELQQEILSTITQNPLLDYNDSDWLDNIMSFSNKNSPEDINLVYSHNKEYNFISDKEKIKLNNLNTSENYINRNNFNKRNFVQNTDKHTSSSNIVKQNDVSISLFQETPVSLHEHLLTQLQLTNVNSRDRIMAIFLIESLNDDGYLSDSLENIIYSINQEFHIELDELQAALSLVQSFDPCGIAARSPAECLRLQLQQFKPSPIKELALNIVDKYLPELAAHDFKQLKRILKVNDNFLKKAHDLIRLLEPFPGAGYSKIKTNYIIPDILLRKTSKGWSTELNPLVVPKLRINSLYANILKNNCDENHTLLKQKLQEAQWFIKNIYQRFNTIQRVAQAIVESQKSFFTYGQTAMRPLVLREIAVKLDLHESTVSRVTAGKYILTPFGILELKYFFSSHISTSTGGFASSTAMRALIKQLIELEDAYSPLSDNKIAKLLAKQGFIVARRTVAKYRENMKIPSANLRKLL